MAAIDQVTTAEQLFKANLQHCELIRGELVARSPAWFERGRIAGTIGAVLMEFAKPQGLGVSVSAGAGFHIAHAPDTVRVPDVAFVRTDRIPPGGVTGFFQGPPDFAVEVLLPDDRTEEIVAKVRDWLQAGCLMVWVVDPETRTISIYRSRSEIAVLSEVDTLTGGDVLPGFAVPVAEIFA